MHFPLFKRNQTAFPEFTSAHEVPDSIAWGYHKSVLTWLGQTV